MKTHVPSQRLILRATVMICIWLGSAAYLPAQSALADKTIDAPNGQTVSLKMIGPVTQTTDLQIICILKHDPNGDKYIEAMNDFNKKLHSLLSGIRDRDE